jgi:hypothetical protein
MNLALRMEREPKPEELQPAEPPPPQPPESPPEPPPPAEPARPPHATPDYFTKAEGPDD